MGVCPSGVGPRGAVAVLSEGRGVALPDKHTLRTVIDRFPTVMFYRDDATLLDHLERRNEVTLPGWLRQARQTLAGPVPGVRIRFDDFDHLGPFSDTRAEDGFLKMTYGDHFVGYTQDEQRALFLDEAGCYPILSATNGVQYQLAASLTTVNPVPTRWIRRSTRTRACSRTSSSASCRAAPSSLPATSKPDRRVGAGADDRTAAGLFPSFLGSMRGRGRPHGPEFRWVFGHAFQIPAGERR